MDFLRVKDVLIKRRHNEAAVNIYVKYLKQLSTQTDKDGKLEAWWFPQQMNEEIAVDLYEKVAIDGLVLDGDTISIGYKKRILLTYNFQAYKNKVLQNYPETTFDLQLVHAGDDFSFHKKNGIVYYTHDIKDPFNETKVIIGVYCIIKNDRGEFIELLNKTEIDKMKAVATMKHIWNNWEGEMWKKSIIKRSCKTHFYDVVKNMDALDNEQYDFDNLEAPESIYDTIKAYDKKQDLLDWASSKVNIPYQNDKEFRAAVSAQLRLLDQDEDHPQTNEKSQPKKAK